jgi:hypothetical protein
MSEDLLEENLDEAYPYDIFSGPDTPLDEEDEDEWPWDIV